MLVVALISPPTEQRATVTATFTHFTVHNRSGSAWSSCSLVVNGEYRASVPYVLPDQPSTVSVLRFLNPAGEHFNLLNEPVETFAVDCASPKRGPYRVEVR